MMIGCVFIQPLPASPMMGPHPYLSHRSPLSPVSLSAQSNYYALVEEMRAAAAKGGAEGKKAEFISWHEGCHLISKGPEASPLFHEIIAKTSRYFNVEPAKGGVRFNWYRDASDWKPFHHDSAAFNPQRARTQDITVGISFGAPRELAFLRAEDDNAKRVRGNCAAGELPEPTRVYFPQTNGMAFSFGRDVNIRWKHGINALTTAEQTAEPRGRISIVLWGKLKETIAEGGSPPMIVNAKKFGGRGGGGRGGGRGGRGGGGGRRR